MKPPHVLLILLVTLFLAGVPASGAQHSSLEGTWYVNGDRNQVARITERRREFEARNEHGQTSRLEYEGRRRVRALDWGGITGELRGDRIDWSNNTYWSRARSSDAQYRQMVGTWYLEGDRNRVASITDNRGELEARNEHGQTTRLEYEGRGRVRAPDWGGIAGELRSDRIQWSNNTYWTRRAHRR